MIARQTYRKIRLIIYAVVVFICQTSESALAFSQDQITVLLRSEGATEESKERLGTRTTVRLAYSGSGLIAALSMRNDPGEAFQWQPDLGWYGFDRISGYVRWRSQSMAVVITAGHFALGIGQGLLFGRPGGTRFSASAPHKVVQNKNRIRGLSATTGARYFSGFSAQASVTTNVSIILFASRRSFDAKKLTGSDSLTWSLSFSEDHHSEDQQKKRNMVGENSAGTALLFESGAVRIGIAHFRSLFDSDVVWANRDTATKGRVATSISGAIQAGNIEMSAEVVVDSRDKTVLSGSVLAIKATPSSALHLVALVRHYPSSPADLRSFGYRKSNALRNSSGILLGWRMRPFPRWIFAASVDWGMGTPRELYHPGKREHFDARTYFEANIGGKTRLRVQYRLAVSRDSDDANFTSTDSFLPDSRLSFEKSTEHSVSRISFELLRPINTSWRVRVRCELAYVSRISFIEKGLRLFYLQWVKDWVKLFVRLYYNFAGWISNKY